MNMSVSSVCKHLMFLLCTSLPAGVACQAIESVLPSLPSCPSVPYSIGTTSAAASLHVHDGRTGGLELPDLILGGVAETNADVIPPYTGSGNASFLLTHAKSGQTSDDGFKIELQDSVLTIKHQENGAFNIFSQVGKGITIDPAGRVGIGGPTKTGQALAVSGILSTDKLAVNNWILTSTIEVGTWMKVGDGVFCGSDGTVVAKEVRVSLDEWHDDVFGQDYRNMSIYDLDTYVKSNHHLPDIPPADVVLQDGISVGEMNALLLKKVEELTLYVIDLQKQLDELKSGVNNGK